MCPLSVVEPEYTSVALENNYIPAPITLKRLKIEAEPDDYYEILSPEANINETASTITGCSKPDSSVDYELVLEPNQSDYDVIEEF
jgi:hypothetical protein